MGNQANIIETEETRAQALHLLNDLCQSWQGAWEAMPIRLEQVLSYLHVADGVDPTPPPARSMAIQALLQPLLDKHLAVGLQVADIAVLASLLADEIAYEKTQPDYRAPGTLYSELHGRLENVIALIIQAPKSIQVRAEYLLTTFGAVPDRDVDNLQVTLELVRETARICDTLALTTAIGTLSALLPRLPSPRNRPVPPLDAAHRRWVIVAVEDDAICQQSIERMVGIVSKNVAPFYEIEFEFYTNRQSGEARLKQLASRPTGGLAPQQDLSHPLALLDMGIPRFENDQMSPSRNEGLELLKIVRSPAINIPAIILTTPSNYLADQATAAGLGVSDYLLKGIDPPERLIEELTRIITARPQRTLRLRRETGRRVVIDNVELTLEPALFRTLSVLADEAPQAVTPHEAVRLLQESFGGYQSLAEPSALYPPNKLNCRNFWGQAYKTTGDSTRALAWLREEQFTLWKSLVAELSAAGISQHEENAISTYMAAHYEVASSLPPEFNAGNIAKHISDIRKRIAEAFNEAGITICPAEEVLSNHWFGEEMAYKIVATVTSTEDEDLPKARPPFRILVLENDIAIWRDPIEKLLRRYGFLVEVACCKQEAIEKSRHFQPNLLCLDMHVPPDLETFHKDFMEGSAENGLRVLEAVQGFLPNIQVIAMTDLADRDALRRRAAYLGVRVMDFVAKRIDPNAPWEAELILKVIRLEDERVRQAFFPLPNLSRVPYIRLWKSRARDNVEVFGQLHTMTGFQLHLLLLLAERPFDPIPTEDLIEAIYGPGATDTEGLKQIVKNVRKKIAAEWFGVTEKNEAKNVYESVLANDAKAGFILNARVQIED